MRHFLAATGTPPATAPATPPTAPATAAPVPPPPGFEFCDEVLLDPGGA